ncbi:ferredoxin [Nocardioides ferulae]|uniref:ferredoxin n=1 Tax=Nocardioides ferulae TaxID=2340821 RepID=UPI000EB22562|nr:ferredoxin [Nocardioides ferulae]
MSARIVVDRDRCEGLGMCEAMAPDYFELDDDEQMSVLREAPSPEHGGRVAAAVASCPVQALSLAG